MSRSRGSKPIPWYIPIFLQLEARVLSLGFAPVDSYSAIPVPQKLDVDPKAMNPMEGKNIKDWPARFYALSLADEKFIQVAISGQYTNPDGFQYSVHVGYGDDRLVPLLSKLQRTQIRKHHVNINFAALWQIVKWSAKVYQPDRNLKKGQPYEEVFERISLNLEKYGIPWAMNGLLSESIENVIVNRFGQPAMTISYALMTGNFDLAQRRLDLVKQKRSEDLEIWARHNTDKSLESIEEFVDARSLSEPFLPNPRFIDGEFIRLAQKAIDERSIESLIQT